MGIPRSKFCGAATRTGRWRSEEHTSELQSQSTISYAVFCLRAEKPLARCLCGAACITAAEYVVGCTVNRKYRMGVWDYSRERGNIQGQVCPKYAALWMLLAAPFMLPQ